MQYENIYFLFVFEKMGTYTITFGDQAENHVGMQKIGEMADDGYSYEDLCKIREQLGGKSKLYKLHKLINEAVDKAYLLVIKNGVDLLLGEGSSDLLYKEMKHIKVDKKAFMKGRVVNKIARWNVCFSDFSQKPDYVNGKGRVVDFADMKVLNKLKKKISKVIDNDCEFQGELNYYYDTSKCGIGYHGDSERRKVIGVRLGDSLPLCYRWYKDCQIVSEIYGLVLQHGDIYIMSDKAVGYDWKKRSIYTLRHAAGSPKYTKWIIEDEV